MMGAAFIIPHPGPPPESKEVISALECVWVHLRPHWLPREVSSIALCGVYNPPASRNEAALLAHLSESIDVLKNSYPDIGLFVMGDLNHLDTSILCRDHSLLQVVQVPTFVRTWSSIALPRRGNAILDQVLTNCVGKFYGSPTTAPPVGRSDHNSVILTAEQSRSSNRGRKKVARPMRNSDIRAFGNAIEKFFPTKVVRLHLNDKPWVTPHLKSLISDRQKAFDKGDTSTWKRLRNRIAREIATAKKGFYRDKIQNLKTADPRKWFQNIKEMANIRKDPAHIEVPGVDPSSTKDVANAINKHLASASQQHPPLKLEDLPPYLPAPSPPPEVSVWEMYHRLRTVKLNKSAGVDGISPRLIREFAFELSQPLTNIFNASLAEGTVPAVWKKADVVPIPKENPPRLQKLRPISLTPIFAKVC
ncbi:Hypp1854 [Branchiostoma lanceolatum]|uniref:Hypp1854 protein n=1 Tax=Branchiostoma lanceolatum TaxID=7740 RepID=A0A8J9ZQ36_BRALA|nr:Hypp1854 [Branchiostoma lanceolatum]